MFFVIASLWPHVYSPPFSTCRIPNESEPLPDELKTPIGTTEDLVLPILSSFGPTAEDQLSSADNKGTDDENLDGKNHLADTPCSVRVLTQYGRRYYSNTDEHSFCFLFDTRGSLLVLILFCFSPTRKLYSVRVKSVLKVAKWQNHMDNMRQHLMWEVDLELLEAAFWDSYKRTQIH